MKAIVYLSLGSNMGDRFKNLTKAVERIDKMTSSKVTAVSPIYETDPIGVKDHPSYLNNAVRLQTDLTPEDFHKECNNIELEMGRTSKGDKNPRPIDIDILLFDNLTIDVEDLTIPHRKMKKRAFVLKPLLDINPKLCCPITHQNYREIFLEKLGQQKIEIYLKGKH
ncbi:MAG: 2-amino-4-hydroxy-6-hydroxymethyldihydropteridine diphosphokinase [candidate division Zixibacteria bacterium]|nr:2-amino-4-hydroxy-6-hydroxymethyldihydropteridine diphosphokinase [candidate division Zixibacteria bacterium]